MKDKFDRVKEEDRQNSNKSILFREIWEQEHQRTYLFNSLYEDDNNSLEVVSKNNEANKYKPATVEPSQQKKE